MNQFYVEDCNYRSTLLTTLPTGAVYKRHERHTCMNDVTHTKLTCDGEACQLDRRRVSRRRQDNKLRLKVAVDNAMTVTVADCFQQLPHVVTNTRRMHTHIHMHNCFNGNSLGSCIAFSASTLLVGCQEEHAACKKSEWWSPGMVICLQQGRCKWFAYNPADSIATPSSIISCFIKI